MIEDIDDLGPRLSTEEAAKTLGISPTTLANWRETREGPGYVKIGDRYLYPSKWVIAYLRKSVVCHSDDECDKQGRGD